MAVRLIEEGPEDDEILPSLQGARDELTRLSIPIPSLVEIVDNESYEQAAAALRSMVKNAKLVEDRRKSITKPVLDYKRELDAIFEAYDDKLTRTITKFKQGMRRYTDELEAQRRKEEARLRDLHRQEEERARLKAEALKARGKDEQADAVLLGVQPVPTVVADVPSVPGLINRSTWKGQVVNFDEFARYAIEHYPSLLLANEKLLQEVARSTKGQMAVPGVEFYPESGFAVR